MPSAVKRLDTWTRHSASRVHALQRFGVSAFGHSVFGRLGSMHLGVFVLMGA